MDALLLLMRLLHIVLGVFWAGALLFNALFLFPAMRDAGPEGAKVGAGLLRRRFLEIVPAAAVLTILSGLWLYWRASAGFQPAYMGSPTGVTFGLGAVFALAAFALGVGIMRPSMLRAAAISQAAMAGPPEEREAQMAAAGALRMRAGKTGRVVAALLTLAVAAMAVARYID